ncbi:MAG: transglycosylase domain-containing protein [Akkermansiaceae bacterium]|nr:transglycosylase domain-containing protein [Akkermansiaceae bacterium]
MPTWRPSRYIPRWKKKLPAWSHTPIIVLLIGSAAGIVALLALIITYSVLASDYPMERVAELRPATVYCDRDGEPLELLGSQPVHASRADIPDFLIQALIAREDARFEDHHGIDRRGLARATLRNLKDRDFTQGASTLTMQLARNCYEIRDPRNTGKLRELHRKLLEMAIARRIEKRYSKDEIITYYLNRIYFGSGCHGIAEAADVYFAKTPDQLSKAECALLVGIIRGPHLFSPLRNPDGALEQRRQTLVRMQAEEMITKKERKALEDEPLELAPASHRQSKGSYLLQALKRELANCIDEEVAAGTNLTVITTIDLPWQERLERELEDALSELESEKGWPHPTRAKHLLGHNPEYLQVAAVTAETKTGGVLALVGGRDFQDSRYDRSYSTRDLGSAFEPFVAAAASHNDKLVIEGKPLQTGRQVSLGEVQRVAKACGLKEGLYNDTEDLLRGSVTASPREMATGLATLAHEGKRPKLHLIREIRNTQGEVLYKVEPEFYKAIKRDAAIDAMSVIEKRSGTRCFTGATASERDAWVLRLGPSGSTAIWIGFDQPKKIASEKRLKALLEGMVERLGNG